MFTKSRRRVHERGSWYRAAKRSRRIKTIVPRSHALSHGHFLNNVPIRNTPYLFLQGRSTVVEFIGRAHPQVSWGWWWRHFHSSLLRVVFSRFERIFNCGVKPLIGYATSALYSSNWREEYIYNMVSHFLDCPCCFFLTPTSRFVQGKNSPAPPSPPKKELV